MKNIQPKEIYEIFIMKNYIRKFVRLNRKNSEEDALLLHQNDKPIIPENFKFLPVKRSINIKKEREDKTKYISFLLEADPSEKLYKEYLLKGDLFTLYYKDELAGLAVVLPIDEKTCELKNIVIIEKFRGMGFGKQMIKYLFDNYKTRFEKMIVGTSENNVPFYVKQGFDKYEKTIKNFFIDNYEEEIWDGDIHCIDMYYYSKNLKI